MFIIFILFSVIFYLISITMYKARINPITIYLSIWVLCVSLHQSGLIYYYELTNTTWIVLISSEVIYVIGCMVGVMFSKNRIQKKSYSINNLESLRKTLRHYIIILSLIASLSIIPKLFYVVRIYGINLISNISQIYLDSITEKMNYAGTFNTDGFIFISVVFSAIYLYKFEFDKVILLPLLLLILSQLTSGSRGSLVSGILLFIAPFVLKNRNHKNKDIVNKKSKKRVIMVVGILFIFLFLITYNRNDGNFTLPYASTLIQSLCSKNKFIYNIVFYVSSPIAVLNEYLKNPIHSYWGAGTFRIFYIIMDKFGIGNYNVNFIEEFLYFIPAPSNALTYLGSLIYDFNYGYTVVVFLLGFLFSIFFCKMQKHESIFIEVITATCFCLVCLSFFAWFLLLSIFWYVLLIGGVLAYILDHKKLH